MKSIARDSSPRQMGYAFLGVRSFVLLLHFFFLSKTQGEGNHCQHRQEAEAKTWRRVAGVLGAGTLLPVDTVLVDAPVADSCHTCVRHGGAPADHLSPPAVPCEARKSETEKIQKVSFFFMFIVYGFTRTGLGWVYEV